VYGDANPNRVKFKTADAGSITITGPFTVSTPTSYHTYKVTWRSGESKAYQDDTLLDTHTTNIPAVDQVVYFNEGSVSGQNVYVDWVFVRKYVSPEPSHGFWGSEESTLSVTVSDESLDKSRGIAGETVTYTATVQDENGNALPSSFKVTLKIDDTILIEDQPLTSDVYNPTTKQLTLQWTVPSISTFHTVKLVWSEQTIDTTTYSAGESSGVEFEIIPIPPTLTPDQICSISLTLIACMVYISFETVREMTENMV